MKFESKFHRHPVFCLSKVRSFWFLPLHDQLRCCPILSGIVWFFLQTSLANDSSATISSTGVVYTPNFQVVLHRERLQIKLDQIRVDYTFFNPSSQDVTLDVAFPLPPTPHRGGYTVSAWDETFLVYDYYSIISGIKSKNFSPFLTLFQQLNQSIPFSNFRHFENGKQKNFEWKVVAWDEQHQDITNTLLDHKIPLSALYLEGFEDIGGLAAQPQIKKELQELNLLQPDGQHVRFQSQIIYFWKTRFPAQKMISTYHHYRPCVGRFLVGNSTNGRLDGIKSTRPPHYFRNYEQDSDPRERTNLLRCLDQIDAQYPDKNRVYLDAYELEYILTTAKNWKGPIRKFRLEIWIPPKHFVLISGIKGFKRISDKLVFSARNWVPKNDLKILFIQKPLAQKNLKKH
jgi:hypothetical protein